MNYTPLEYYCTQEFSWSNCFRSTYSSSTAKHRDTHRRQGTESKSGVVERYPLAALKGKIEIYP